jgi:hypothetical protein
LEALRPQGGGSQHQDGVFHSAIIIRGGARAGPPAAT